MYMHMNSHVHVHVRVRQTIIYSATQTTYMYVKSCTFFEEFVSFIFLFQTLVGIKVSKSLLLLQLLLSLVHQRNMNTTFRSIPYMPFIVLQALLNRKYKNVGPHHQWSGA